MKGYTTELHQYPRQISGCQLYTIIPELYDSNPQLSFLKGIQNQSKLKRLIFVQSFITIPCMALIVLNDPQFRDCFSKQ